MAKKQNIEMDAYEIKVTDWSQVSDPEEIRVVFLDTIDRGIFRTRGNTELARDVNTMYRLLDKQPDKVTKKFLAEFQDLVERFNKARNKNKALLDDKTLTKADFDKKSGKGEDKTKGKQSGKGKKSKDGAFNKDDLSDLLDDKLKPITKAMPTDKDGKPVKVAKKSVVDDNTRRITTLENHLGKWKKNKFVFHANQGGFDTNMFALCAAVGAAIGFVLGLISLFVGIGLAGPIGGIILGVILGAIFGLWAGSAPQSSGKKPKSKS